MQRSDRKILTTHVGSLIRPPVIIDAMRRAEANETYDELTFEQDLRTAVADVVAAQVQVGIDVPSDGEFGKRGWSRYVTERLGGIEYLPYAAADRSSVVYDSVADYPGFYSVYSEIEQTLWLPPSEKAYPRSS